VPETDPSPPSSTVVKKG